MDVEYRLCPILYRIQHLQKLAAESKGLNLLSPVSKGLKWTLKKMWKPVALAAAVGTPLYIGSKLLTMKHEPTPSEQAKMTRHNTLLYGAPGPGYLPPGSGPFS
jgi:hypothetical protein